MAVVTVAGTLQGAADASAAKEARTSSAWNTSTLAVAPTATSPAAAKAAVDLQGAITTVATAQGQSWVHDVNGLRYAKAIFVAKLSANPELSSLRQSTPRALQAATGATALRNRTRLGLSGLDSAGRCLCRPLPRQPDDGCLRGEDRQLESVFDRRLRP